MIQARLAAPRRAALLSTLILAAAVLRAVLLPLSDLLSTLVFAACLFTITVVDRPHLDPPPRVAGGEKSRAGEGERSRPGDGTLKGALAGVALGALLLAPVISGHLSDRPLSAFWSWALIAAVIATLEETAIRGVLYRRWSEEAGPVAAIVIGAIVFALIHLTRYGFGAMPLDFAVGLALGGLRALTGRVMPCAIAHAVADWGAWFWA